MKRHREICQGMDELLNMVLWSKCLLSFLAILKEISRDCVDNTIYMFCTETFILICFLQFRIQEYLAERKG